MLALMEHELGVRELIGLALIEGESSTLLVSCLSTGAIYCSNRRISIPIVVESRRNYRLFK